MHASADPAQHLYKRTLIEGFPIVKDDDRNSGNRDAALHDSRRDQKTVFPLSESFDILLSLAEVGIDIGAGKEARKDQMKDAALPSA